ncbi:hypothetical protein GUJ93_ZPchr0006g43450 [Zizania palustris]|uniref:Uncharacterized protein n=1 Tax=Zizania palustris TaxID=103762 RepID=A0A8J5W257_ZIZPA|nr:hypothetical protein GUJ93_ZPchr0006g43450 [Zizania palustris]
MTRSRALIQIAAAVRTWAQPCVYGFRILRFIRGESHAAMQACLPFNMPRAEKSSNITLYTTEFTAPKSQSLLHVLLPEVLSSQHSKNKATKL